MAALARKENQKRLYHMGRVLQTVFEGISFTAAENCSQRLILVCRAAKLYAKRDSTCLASSIIGTEEPYEWKSSQPVSLLFSGIRICEGEAGNSGMVHPATGAG